jgi:hypothetical protein
MTDTLSTRLPTPQMLTTRLLCMKCCALYTEIPRRQESYIKLWMPSSRVKGSTLSDLRNLCRKGLTVCNMLKTSMCQFTWMTVLLYVNQRTLWQPYRFLEVSHVLSGISLAKGQIITCVNTRCEDWSLYTIRSLPIISILPSLIQVGLSINPYHFDPSIIL